MSDQQSNRIHIGDVRVRYAAGAYVAHGFGRRASATAGAATAVDAVMRKTGYPGWVVGEPAGDISRMIYPIYSEQVL